MKRSGRGSAPARAALAGNPSDGYGGAVLALTLPGWEARASATPATRWHVEPPSRLVAATLERFSRQPAMARSPASQPANPAQPCQIAWETTIPQGVGLGGSSAIVIAVTRALCQLHELTVPPAELAEFALAVETEELGIVAGLQDRVAQSFGGLTFMEFGDQPVYRSLDQTLLPELLVAWHAGAACESGEVHRELRERHAAGDRAIQVVMTELAATARTARDALLDGDHSAFCACLDRTFDLRREVMPLDQLGVAMVEAARAAGAAANYTGSGGAIVAAGPDRATLDVAAAELSQLGCAMIHACRPATSQPPSPAR